MDYRVADLSLADFGRKEIALAWDKLPAPVQESCTKAAQVTGDYWKLKNCIDREAPIIVDAPGH